MASDERGADEGTDARGSAGTAQRCAGKFRMLIDGKLVKAQSRTEELASAAANECVSRLRFIAQR